MSQNINNSSTVKKESAFDGSQKQVESPNLCKEKD